MRDKDVVAGLLLFSFLLYLIYPHPPLSFIFLAPLVFFVPGFFVLKLLYRDMGMEELVLLSFGVSLAFSGAVALLLSSMGVLYPAAFAGALLFISALGYFLSGSIELAPLHFSMPDRFTAVLLVIMLLMIAAWGYHEAGTNQYRELDIGITAWPQNATLNSTLNFTVYVANQNYGPANCTVVFYLNSHRLASKSVSLDSGMHTLLNFTAHTNKTGRNLASFDLYANGKKYTNVHVYFDVKK